jgi:MYXO-CTERM domain-containing protein
MLTVRRLCLACLLVTLPGAAIAYEREQVADSPGVYLFWQSRVITYYINSKGYSLLPLSEVAGAIRRSFFSWASPSCTDIEFNFSGYETITKTNLVLAQNEQPDHKNLIIWHEDRWPPEGVTDPSLNEKIPAITTLIYDAKTGRVADADIDVNGFNYHWTTTDDLSAIDFDVQNSITHEVGHLLGLGHSPEAEATMYSTETKGETKKRSLEKDDTAGICFIYPFKGDTPVGAGQGTIRNDVQGGCSVVATGAASSSAALLPFTLLLVALLQRRRRSS